MTASADQAALAPDVEERARRIKLLVLDVDGVLTDGRLVYDRFGHESKVFDVQDGFGVWIAGQLGIPSAIMTARRSRVVRHRAREMGVHAVHQRVLDKGACLRQLLDRFHINADQACFVGDDLVDLSPMRQCGFSVAVANAVDEVKALAHYVTQRSGGRGAVREITDLLLRAQGQWSEVLSRYGG